MHQGSLAIVVPSCDSYSDLWDAYFANLQAVWPECPFPIYLVANRCGFDATQANGVNTILVGDDMTWSANLLKALPNVAADYVLLMMDDLFPTSRLDGKRILGLATMCIENKWDYLRLNPTPGPPLFCRVDDSVGRIPRGDIYRSSTVFSIWKRDVLMATLDPGEDAWHFEILGSSRTDRFESWYAATRWNVPFCNLVIKGKIDPLALRKLRNIGIELTTRRQVMTPLEAVSFQLRKLRSKSFQAMPRKLQRRIRSIFAAA
jgi:hypothetical protein